MTVYKFLIYHSSVKNDNEKVMNNAFFKTMLLRNKLSDLLRFYTFIIS
jgi:hypothetical protein